MFDIGWPELFLIGVVALIVIGPKDLPRAMRTVSQYLRKARALACDFQRGVEDMAREADLDDLKKDVTSAAGLDDVTDLKRDIESSSGIADLKDIKRGFDSDVEAELAYDDAVDPTGANSIAPPTASVPTKPSEAPAAATDDDAAPGAAPRAAAKPGA